jgi:mannose-6-phosphate isomerase
MDADVTRPTLLATATAATARSSLAPLTRRGALAALAALPALAGCSDPDGSYRNRIDTGWHRDDMEALMLRWQSHAPRPDGSFQARFDRAWKPLPQTEVTLAQQAHLVYAFAAVHEFMPDAGCMAIAKRGASYMLLRFRDEINGGFFHSVGPDGRPQSTQKHADEHAFVLQTLAELYRLTGDVRYREAAQLAWQDIERGLSDTDGGLYTVCDRNFQPVDGPRSQLPVMHMFDALLALRAASGDKVAETAARRLGDFAANKLLQGQADGGALIPERYDAAWKPLATRNEGGLIDLGHQFAWSHLLATGAVVSSVYAQVGERLLAYAMATGYDEAAGGCGSWAFPDGGKPEMQKGWRQQAECLQGLLAAAQASGRTDLWRRYEQTQSLIKRELVDPEHGGWRAADALPCKSGGCRDEQPDPYPIVRLHQAALKAAS